MTMTVTPRSPRQRNPVLGQLPPITRADGSPIRVLLVDDEPALTNLLKMALHYEGWHIEVARDGREALTKFEEFGPDLLVLDEALERLAKMDPQLAQVVELRFFAGLQMQEIGPLLGVSTSSVERAWRTASAWLRAELGTS